MSFPWNTFVFFVLILFSSAFTRGQQDACNRLENARNSKENDKASSIPLICPEKGPDGNVSFVDHGVSRLIVRTVFGRTNEEIDKYENICELIRQYRLNDGDWSSNNTFTNLRANTLYRVSSRNRYRNFKTNKISTWSNPMTSNMRTTGAQLELFNVVKIEEKNNIVSVSWSTSRYPDHTYQIEWKPAACEKHSWANTEPWISLKNKNITLNEKDFPPYAEITFNYYAAENGKYGTVFTEKYTTSVRAVPENEILEITCEKDTCTVKIENNCYKRNGPKMYLRFWLATIETNPSTGLALHKSENFTQSKSDDFSGTTYKFYLPNDLFNFTCYNLSVSLAMANKKFNKNTRKSITYRTPPSEPNKVENISLISSAKSVGVRWQNPSQENPRTRTGEPEMITLHLKNEYYKYPTKDISLKVVDLEEEANGWYNWYIDASYTNHEYSVVVSIKNKDVETETKSDKFFVQTVENKPSPPVITNITGTCCRVSLNVSRPKDMSVTTNRSEIVLTSIGTEISINSTHFYGSKYENQMHLIENLSEDTRFTLQARACGIMCSNWTLPYSAWTRPDPPLQDKIHIEFFSETTIKFRVEKLEYRGEWKRFFIGRNVTSAEENIRMHLEQQANATELVIQKDDNGNHLWILPVAKSFSGIYEFSIQNDVGNIMLAEAIFIYRDFAANPFFKMSNFTMPFTRKDNDPPLGVTSQVFISLLIIVIMAASIFFTIRTYGKRKGGKTTEKVHPASHLTHFHLPHDTLARALSISLPPNAQKPDPVSEEQQPLETTDTDSIGGIKDTLANYIISENLEYDFKSVPVHMPHLHSTHGQSSMNLRKNRYKNNLPYDETRVILPYHQSDPSSDYINASYVDTPFRKKCFIATQGPKDTNIDTRSDFWRMVWHTHPSHIVMVACLIEGGKKKVAQYWPDGEEPVRYGDFIVNLLGFQQELDYVVRYLSVTYKNRSIEVNHYQFTEWPDHGVPQMPHTFALLTLRLVKEMTDNQPIVVHCSAGIGRTGTLLLSLLCLKQIFLAKYVNGLEGLQYLRNGRPRLVENWMQFRFAHEIILEVLNCKERRLDPYRFVEMYADLHNQMFYEFQEISSLKWKLHERLTFSIGSTPEVQHLNRNVNVLPADSNVVFVERTDTSYLYVNAIHLQIGTAVPLVVAEHPTSDTEGRMWQLIFENQVSIWILGNGLVVDENSPSVLPEKVFRRGGFQIEVVQPEDFFQAQDLSSEFVVQIYNNNGESHVCKLIRMFSWSLYETLPQDAMELTWLLQTMMGNSDGRPLLISCSDGVTACGIIATLFIALKDVENEGFVDIFKATLKTLSVRPEFIISEEQYQYIYEFVCHYIYPDISQGHVND